MSLFVPEANTASSLSPLVSHSSGKPVVAVTGARGSMTGTRPSSGAMVGARAQPGTAASSSSIGVGQKRKRKSRWSDAPPGQLQEDKMISEAISSFDQPSVAQMTPEQIRQMIEQQEVNRYCSDFSLSFLITFSFTLTHKIPR